MEFIGHTINFLMSNDIDNIGKLDLWYRKLGSILEYLNEFKYNNMYIELIEDMTHSSIDELRYDIYSTIKYIVSELNKLDINYYKIYAYTYEIITAIEIFYRKYLRPMESFEHLEHLEHLELNFNELNLNE